MASRRRNCYLWAPEMDGVRFLDAMRQIQPDATRILFSGHADKDVRVREINGSEIFGYIAKLWREYELKSAVSQAVACHNLLRENHSSAELMAR